MDNREIREYLIVRWTDKGTKNKYFMVTKEGEGVITVEKKWDDAVRFCRSRRALERTH